MENNINKLLNEKLTLFYEIDKKVQQNSLNPHLIHQSLNKEHNVVSSPYNNNLDVSDLIINNKNKNSSNGNRISDKKTNYFSSRNDSSKSNLIYGTNKASKNTLKSFDMSTKSGKTTQRTGFSRSKSEKNLKRDNKDESSGQIRPDVGDRLYQRALLLKEKKEKKIQNYQDKLIREMTPEITTKSKEMKFNENVYERLYPKKTINVNVNIQTFNKVQINNNTNINQYIRDKEMTFKPKINKTSEIIAKKMEPSLQRLTRSRSASRSKSLSKTGTNLKNKDNNSNNVPQSKTIYHNVSKSPKSLNNSKAYILYEQGLEQMKKREKIYQKHKNEQENEYKKFPFKPSISPRHSNSFVSSTTNNSSNKLNKKKDLYESNVLWKKNILQKNELNKQKKIKEKEKESTFKPNIQRLNIADDVKCIKRNISQFDQYVDRRQKILKNKEEQKEYEQKIFNPGMNYKPRPTIPKEPALRTKSRSRSPSYHNLRDLRSALGVVDYFEKYPTEHLIETNDSYLAAVNNLHDQLRELSFKLN